MTTVGIEQYSNVSSPGRPLGSASLDLTVSEGSREVTWTSCLWALATPTPLQFHITSLS